MGTILLTFANRQTELLPTLQEEDDAISRFLLPRSQQQHFFLHRESYTTVDELPELIGRYRAELSVFHFSGHAGRDRLVMGDGDAYGAGLAQLLGQCPQLKLVVLNGCSTQGLVTAMQQQGIPVVLATNAPVQDTRATYFSTRFYEGLCQQMPIRLAFEMAKGALETKFSDSPFAHADTGLHRSMLFVEDEQADSPAWGLYVSPQSEHILDWRLPTRAPTHDRSGFEPNTLLIETLFGSLSEYNAEVQRWHKQAKSGVQVPMNKKRMAVLNALPAPLGEPLRKLMVPVPEEDEGYDKVSLARLKQITQAYCTALELLAFTMLAQLWELYDTDHPPQLSEEEKKAIGSLFRLKQEERNQADLIPFIKAIRDIFESRQINYFIQELEGLRELIASDVKFVGAISFLSAQRKQVLSEEVDESSLSYLCKTAEESLAYLYQKMSFMARYRLATIQRIQVQKYRHQQQASFDHTTVMLHDLLGGFDTSYVALDRSMDNRSVLLINEDNWDYLNLSPFVIDENAFQENAKLCKLYFFSHYLPAAQTFCFKYVNKPDDDAILEISEDKYPLVKEQFDAFAALILQQDLPLS